MPIAIRAETALRRAYAALPAADHATAALAFIVTRQTAVGLLEGH
jgi:hypothetical protein